MLIISPHETAEILEINMLDMLMRIDKTTLITYSCEIVLNIKANAMNMLMSVNKIMVILSHRGTPGV